MFYASKRKSGGKGEGYANLKDLATAIVFLAFYYYSKPENAATAASETHVGLIKSLFKWISQSFH